MKNQKIDNLVARAKMVRAIRDFFDSRDFVEVETPVRIAAPAPECHIDCPNVATGGFLRASPELQMKKLLAIGMDKIYQIGPCFRDGEKGSRHNPEFTMLEWYRRDATYLDIARDMNELLATISSRFANPETITVRDAYREWAGWDPFETWDEDRFDFDMATKIEPALKEKKAVFLTDYPSQAASLARIRDNVAERWEFYFEGMELANCFSELCDPIEQRSRFEKARESREKFGESRYPLDEEFFDLLAMIPSAAGVALGIDRLAMVIANATDIASVRAN